MIDFNGAKFFSLEFLAKNSFDWKHADRCKQSFSIELNREVSTYASNGCICSMVHVIAATIDLYGFEN